MVEVFATKKVLAYRQMIGQYMKLEIWKNNTVFAIEIVEIQ
jgi:hypothetical protein